MVCNYTSYLPCYLCLDRVDRISQAEGQGPRGQEGSQQGGKSG